MRGLVAEVTQAERPVFSKLLLEAQIPLLHIGVLQMQRLNVIDAVLGKCDIRLQHDRKRIAAGVVLPRIGKRWIRKRHLSAVR